MYSAFEIESKNGITHLKLNRPQQMNSMTKEFWNDLPKALDEIESDAELRVIIISGNGAHFSSGMDLSVFESGDQLKTKSPDDRAKMKQLILWLQNCFNRLEQCRVPVIAATHGACIGAGLDMIAACDMRYATQDAYFTIMETNLGMMADLGSLQRLSKVMPHGVVRELAYTGDKLDATRARDLGLVNKIYATQEEMLWAVSAVANRIAGKAPLAVSASKEALNFARDHSVRESLEQCASLQAYVFSNEDLRESMIAKKEKRNTKFNNPSLFNNAL